MPRSWLRMCIATAHPPSSWPTTRSAPTRTSSKATSASSSVPFACSIADTVDPLGTEVDDERGQAAVTRVGCPGPRQHEAPCRVLRPAGPDLSAGDHVFVAVPAGGRAQVGEIRAGVWLGEALRPEVAPGEEGRECLGDEVGRAVATSAGARISRCSNRAMPVTPWRASASHIAARCAIVPPSPPSVVGPSVARPAGVVEGCPSGRTSSRLDWRSQEVVVVQRRGGRVVARATVRDPTRRSGGRAVGRAGRPSR